MIGSRRAAAAIAVIVTIASTGAVAQQPVAPTEPRPTQEPATLTESRYDETRSWALFSACDADGDDRLSLFEARRCIVDLGVGDGLEAFRRVDTDANGFVEWPEFDRRFRRSIEQTGSFRVRPTRRVTEPTGPSSPGEDSDPVHLLIRAVDTDGDDRLDVDEFTDLLRRAKEDTALAQGFVALDADRSGELDKNELGPALQFLPGAWKLMPGEGNEQANLPPEFRAVDRDLDGNVQPAELETALKRTHPTLARWAARIVGDADRTGNGSLGAAELRAASN